LIAVGQLLHQFQHPPLFLVQRSYQPAQPYPYAENLVENALFDPAISVGFSGARLAILKIIVCRTILG
jgi:hypothetical protein